MLQQTVRTAVVPYFDKWMETYPDLESLASSSEQEVVRLWEGLGYYSRARNILKTAQLLHDQQRGMPREYDQLIKLPGIGPYTASAIMSMSYNKAYLVLDANVKRIFMRLFLQKEWSSTFETQVQQMYESWSKEGTPRFWSEALMQLGQQVCRATNPLCDNCPLQQLCSALDQNLVDSIPQKKVRTITTKKTALLLLVHGDSLLITPFGQGRFRGMWGFPQRPYEKGEELLRSGFVHLLDLKERTHTYTKYKDLLYPSLYRSDNKSVVYPGSQWVPFHQINTYPMPSVYRKILEEALRAIDHHEENHT